jgi:tetratricopeptide (TPR) repeat protein
LAADQFLLNAEKALEIIKPAEIASAAPSPSVAAKVTATPTSFSKNSTALQADSSFPKMLLQAAREAYRRERLGECLERCAEVIDGHKDSPEAAEAVVLHQLIASQPEKMLVAQREIDERLTRRYLVLGDQWREKQNLNEARKCYEKALSLSPVPVLASQARTRLEDLKTFMK